MQYITYNQWSNRTAFKDGHVFWYTRLRYQL